MLLASPPARRGGYGYVLNRDRLRLGAGTYAGNGNRGVHPLGKMVEVEAKTPGSVTVDCEDGGVGATVHAGDRHAVLARARLTGLGPVLIRPGEGDGDVGGHLLAPLAALDLELDLVVAKQGAELVLPRVPVACVCDDDNEDNNNPA